MNKNHTNSDQNRSSRFFERKKKWIQNAKIPQQNQNEHFAGKNFKTNLSILNYKKA